MKVASSVLVFLAGLMLRVDAATVEVSTCDDLETAAAATATEDTTATFTSSSYITLDCTTTNDEGESEVRSFVVENNILTLEAPDVLTLMRLISIRFNLTNSGELLVPQDVRFQSDIDNIAVDKDGGFMYVGEDSKALFQGDLEVSAYQTRSATNGGDFAIDDLDGGCLSNDGYFRVEGYTTFESCDNSGGGESPPGRGGAIFNRESGSILFVGGVRIQDTALTDNEGGSGAGIYNLGKVNIKGNSIFYNLVADTEEAVGGAIFNGEGAKFTFRNKAGAAFIDNDGSGGSALYNQGEFNFAGPALFTLNTNTVIENRSPGFLKLSSESSFWLIDTEEDLGAVVSYSGATLDFPDDLVFYSLEGTTTECDYINVETDDGFDCFS